MNMKPPLLFDNLDNNNKESSKPPVVKQTYYWIPMVIGITFICLFLLVWAIIGRLDWVARNTLDETERGIAIALTYIIPLSLFSLVIIGAVSAIRYVWLKSNRERLVNVWESQSTIDKLDRDIYTQQLIERTLDAVLARAQQSKFAGVQTLTWDQSRQITNSVDPDEDTEEVLEDSTDNFVLPTLLELKKQNFINRSGNSIFIGFANEEDVK